MSLDARKLGIGKLADLERPEVRAALESAMRADRRSSMPALPPGSEQRVPVAVVDAGVARVRSDPRWRALADAFTTARVGRAALEHRYRVPAGTDWLGLESDLRAALLRRFNRNGASPAIANAAKDVVVRIRDVQRFLEAPRDSRNPSFALHAVGPNPWRPARVSVSKWRQLDVQISTGGGRTAVVRYQDLSPAAGSRGTVLLLHGHGSRLEEYEGIAARLRDRYRILIPDLPSSGYSEMPVLGQYTLEKYMAYVQDFLDRVVGDAPVFVAGGSLGANLALRLGARDPGRYRKVAAWAPGSAWSPGDVGVQLTIAGLDIARFGLPGTVWDRFWVVYTIQRGFWGVSDEALAADERYKDEIRSESYAVAYFDIAKQQLQSSLHTDLVKNDSPVFLAIGKHDDTPGLNQGARALALRRDLFGDVRLEEYDTSHSIADLAPDALAADLRAFFD